MNYKVDIRLNELQRWLWPPTCLLCRGRASVFGAVCADCDRSLPRVRHACPRCAAPDVGGHGLSACGECQRHPPDFDRAHALFRYAAPVDGLILRLKYRGRLELSRPLGEYLAHHLQSLNEPSPDVIVPVPLHASRLRERGYNQALEIARFIARRLRIPLDGTGATRVRATVPQAELNRAERRKNVRGAFRVGTGFEGKSVAIVDDVMTSGHTANALAVSLRRGGASAVRVWVVARA